ncbi:hypothetical protein HHK36_003006 [Tetracentron sinense]|uniref:Uncharacterized protein n=1 Tax=Tetracentron sinense TaxID=13715 RepID=A0A835DS30_TETSI|nr:hypothetical protein HHK36_003006 [Tetracentron sinense]
MGSVSLTIGDGTARFRRASLCSSALNLLMLFSVLTTNLFALYAFTSSPTNHPVHHTHKNISLISEHVSLILREIDSSEKKLAQMEKELLGYENIDLSRPNIANELKLFLKHHPLPLGKDSRTGITEMVASVGHSCEKSVDLLSQYMNYKVGGACLDDWSLAQKLILRGCEPLPRRRCFAKSIAKVDLFPFPLSLWKPVSDKIVSWSGLGCKNFECLNSKKIVKDCDNCFDLVNGFEKQRFVKARSKNDFVLDDVLALGSGGIRIGFDIGGGSGSFAARMAERNVTVVSSTLNVEAPFSEFIAARGLFPLFMSLDQRFPFYDNVFDLVHASNGLGDGNRPEKMEFLMFDIDRILRAGGLFWLDNFYCADEERKRILTRLIERFGYKKLKWVVGEKINAAGTGKPQVYLSAVLQKPCRKKAGAFMEDFSSALHNEQTQFSTNNICPSCFHGYSNHPVSSENRSSQSPCAASSIRLLLILVFDLRMHVFLLSCLDVLSWPSEMLNVFLDVIWDARRVVVNETLFPIFHNSLDMYCFW